MVSEHTQVLLASTSALGRLARHEDGQEAVIKGKAIKHALQICRNAISDHLLDSQLVANCLSVIGNLAVLEPASGTQVVEDGVVDNGSVPVLISICEKATDAKVLIGATRALANLALDKAGKGDLIKNGAIQPLLDICNRTDEDGVLAGASDAVRNLARHKANRPQLIAMGVVPVMVALCRGCATSMDAAANAAAAIANIALYEEGRVQITSEGALDALIWLAAQVGGLVDSSAVLSNAVVALRNLSRTEGLRGEMLASARFALAFT